MDAAISHEIPADVPADATVDAPVTATDPAHMPDPMSTLIHDFIRPKNKWRAQVFWYDDSVEYRYFVNRDSALDYWRDLKMEFRHRRNYDMVEIRMSEKNSDGAWNEPDYYVNTCQYCKLCENKTVFNDRFYPDEEHYICRQCSNPHYEMM